jgi:hypothetical protein
MNATYSDPCCTIPCADDQFASTATLDFEPTHCPACGVELPTDRASLPEGATCPSCRSDVRFLEGADPGAVEVRLPKRMDLRAAQNELFEPFLSRGNTWPAMIVDVSRVAVFSALIGRLSHVNTIMGQRGARMKIVASPDSLARRMLRVLGLEKRFSVYDDVERALAFEHDT